MQYIESATRLFRMYNQLGEKAIAQIDDKDLSWQQNEDSNSISNIVKHLWGNMLSRWTDFLTTDGEKPWRTRDAEFEPETYSRTELMKKWEEGWQCLFDALSNISDADLERIIYIRNDGLTVMDAINRQIAHYSYHVGQIVYISKLRSHAAWNSLSIPRNMSGDYNSKKFEQEKGPRDFTDEWRSK